MRFKNNTKGIFFDDVIIAIILLLATFWLLGNTISVLNKGEVNKEIYEAEFASWQNTKETNSNLISEVSFLMTDEYKRLRARDIYNLALPDETLLRPVADPYFYEVEMIPIDLDKKENYSDWWNILLDL